MASITYQAMEKPHNRNSGQYIHFGNLNLKACNPEQF